MGQQIDDPKKRVIRPFFMLNDVLLQPDFRECLDDGHRSRDGRHDPEGIGSQDPDQDDIPDQSKQLLHAARGRKDTDALHGATPAAYRMTGWNGGSP